MQQKDKTRIDRLSLDWNPFASHAAIKASRKAATLGLNSDERMRYGKWSGDCSRTSDVDHLAKCDSRT
jgi:hypothetical protein